MNVKRAIVVGATGTFATIQGGGNGFLKGASLRAAAAAAKATIRQVNDSGTVIAILAAGVALSDHLPEGAIPYETALHVTLEGAAAECIIYV